MAAPRVATVSRKTNETDIQVDLNLDATQGSGITQVIQVKTGIGFLDHVRTKLPRYISLTRISDV
jgi:imidazoleglycerol-phosphate dehydratase